MKQLSNNNSVKSEFLTKLPCGCNQDVCKIHPLWPRNVCRFTWLYLTLSWRSKAFTSCRDKSCPHKGFKSPPAERCDCCFLTLLRASSSLHVSSVECWKRLLPASSDSPCIKEGWEGNGWNGGDERGNARTGFFLHMGGVGITRRLPG